MLLDFRPTCRWEHQNCELPPGKILLLTQIFVCGNERVERFLRRRQQFPVFQFRLSHFKSGGDRVRSENFPQRRWSALIKENFHDAALARLRHGQTLLRMFQDGLDVFTRHP